MEANLRILQSFKKINEKINDNEEKQKEINKKIDEFLKDVSKEIKEIDNENQDLKKELSETIEKVKQEKPKDGKDGKDGRDGKDGYTPVKGKDYFDGRDGIDGIDGKNGLDGKNGKDGKNGQDGEDGVGIYDIEINDKGELIVILTNNKKINCGVVKGKDGVGYAGVSVTDAKIIDGELVITLSTGRKINAGAVVGEPGEAIEKDPVFAKSPAGSITNENIESWNNKVEDENYVHTDNNFTDEYKEQITTNKEDISKLDDEKATKEEVDNSKPIQFETILGTNYQLISTTANYEETIEALENKKMVYSTMICEGVENGYMYPTEWKTQMDDPYISFVYHFRRGHEINEVWMHIRESGYNTTEWRILENSQMKRTYETGWQDVPDDDHYVSERLLVDTFQNFQALGDKVQSVKDNSGSETKYPSAKAVAEYTDSQCGVVLDYMQTTFAENIMALAGLTFTKKPAIIYDNANGFEASNDDAGDTWHLTGLDLSPYKRLKFYVRSGGDGDANYSPAHVVEMHLDDRAKGSFGYFSADHAGHCPNNRNRHHIVTFIVNAEKTAIQFQHAISIYGTAASNSAGGRSCYLIEGYYD